MSLRTPTGTKVDDVAYEGCEEELATAIADGTVRLRGVGIHQSVRCVRADFAACGLLSGNAGASSWPSLRRARATRPS